MKKILVLITALIVVTSALAGCGTKPGEAAPSQTQSQVTEGSALKGVVKTGGSTSMEKVCETLKQAFIQNNPEVTVNIEYNGSGDGIKGAGSGTYDIGNASRSLKDTETGLKAHVLGIDGIAVIVNNENSSVSDISLEQLGKIYTGKIKNWKELGGEDKPIAVVSREEGSGTRDGFQSIIGFKSEELTKDAEIGNSTGNIITTVSSNKDAIGYISLSEINSTVKSLKVEGAEPTVDNIKSGAYKVQRSFIMVTKEGAQLSPQAQAYLDFCFSQEAAGYILKAGLIPVQEK